MTQQSKMPLDIEKKIQTLAGDIYAQIEDKVSAFVATHALPTDISTEVIENHATYKQLKTELSQLKNSTLSDSLELETCHKTISELNNQLASRDKTITDIEQSNVSQTLDNDVKSQSLEEANTQIEKLLLKIKALEDSEDNLTISDCAKTATLEVQSQQISDYKLHLDTAKSELDALKFNKKKLSNKQLSKEAQKEIEELKQTITTLQKSVTDSEALLNNEQKNIELLNQQLTISQEQLLTQATANSELETKLVESTKVITNFNQEKSQNKSSVKALEENIASLKDKLSTSEQQLTALKLLLTTESNNKEHVEKNHLLETEALKQSIDKHREELSALSLSDKNNSDKIDELNQIIIDDKKTIQAFENQLNTQKITIEEQTKAHQLITEQSSKVDLAAQNKINDLSDQLSKLQKNIIDLTTTNTKLTGDFDAVSKDVARFKQENAALSENHQNMLNSAQETQKRLESNKNKQESEYNQARETIKQLRDENRELNMKLDTQVTELEDKLREYRLRFEYAQKQLSHQQKLSQ